jgi:tyrosinase
MARQPIVILGAGIAGLTLGRCLAQKGIPSVVYERTTCSPRHNYGITLREWAYIPLLRIFNLDDDTFRCRIAVDSRCRADASEVWQDASMQPNNSLTHSFRVNRSKLERLLAEGQEIKWEYNLSHPEVSQSGAGAVEIMFQESLSLASSFIVDTLGVGSPLRNSLLPECRPTILPFVVFRGKRCITRDQFCTTYAPHLKDTNSLRLKLAKDRTVALHIWVNGFLPNGDVDITYVYSRAVRLDHDQHPDPLHRPGRSPAAAIEIPDAFYQELQQLPANEELPEPFATTFSLSMIRDERLLHWLMRDLLVSTDDLCKLLFHHNIVMIGDSVHATPILGGEGANHAIKDAIELAKVIAASASASASASETSTATGLDRTAVMDFYKQCESRWKDEVRASRRKIAQMHCVIGVGIAGQLPCYCCSDDIIG